MRIPKGALVALLATEFSYASLAATSKLAVRDLDPLFVAGVRVLLGGSVLAIMALSVAREWVERKDLAKLAGLAVLGVVINQGLFLLGVARTTATNATILIATIPVFTVLVALVLRKEHAVPARIVGILVSFSGVGVLLGVEDFNLDPTTVLGDLLILTNSLSFSFYLVLSRPLLAKYRSSTVVMWTFLFAGLVLAPVGAWQGADTEYTAVRGTSWAALAWVVAIGTVVAYTLNNYALKRLDASTVASFIFLQPILGVALAVILVGETVGWRAVVGGVLVLSGLLVVTRTEARPVGTTDVAGPPEPEPTREVKL